MPAPRKPKPQPQFQPEQPQPEPQPQAKTVTVTTSQRHVTRIRAADQVFPVGQPVDNVPQETIDALEAMPGVTVDVAGTPDADTPTSPAQE